LVWLSQLVSSAYSEYLGFVQDGRQKRTTLPAVTGQTAGSAVGIAMRRDAIP
jgi:hypothetical protein